MSFKKIKAIIIYGLVVILISMTIETSTIVMAQQSSVIGKGSIPPKGSIKIKPKYDFSKKKIGLM